MGIVNVVGYAAQVEKCYECNYLENIVFEVKLYDTYDTPSPWADDKNDPCTVHASAVYASPCFTHTPFYISTFISKATSHGNYLPEF